MDFTDLDFYHTYSFGPHFARDREDFERSKKSPVKDNAWYRRFEWWLLEESASQNTELWMTAAGSAREIHKTRAAVVALGRLVVASGLGQTFMRNELEASINRLEEEHQTAIEQFKSVEAGFRCTRILQSFKVVTDEFDRWALSRLVGPNSSPMVRKHAEQLLRDVLEVTFGAEHGIDPNIWYIESAPGPDLKVMLNFFPRILEGFEVVLGRVSGDEEKWCAAIPRVGYEIMVHGPTDDAAFAGLVKVMLTRGR